MSNSLLSNQEYLLLIRNIIIEEKLKYELPIYSLDHIKDWSSSEFMQFQIDDDLFLETLYMRIRGESIKFASNLKKMNDSQEKELKKDIEILESNSSLSREILDDKKQELEKLREHKLKGHLIRSRLNWLNEGEKPSKYFCNLEKKTSQKRPFEY